MSNSEHNKQQLIEHLYAVLAAESEKPYEEIDADFVEACTELILELQGKNFTLSNEELDELVRKIPFIDANNIKVIEQQKKIRKFKTKKILLIAAIIALLCALLLVGTTSHYLDDWHRYFIETYGSLEKIPIGKIFAKGDEEVSAEGDFNIYHSTEDFYKSEGCHVLLPGKLPNGVNLSYIQIPNNKKSVYAVFESVVTGYEIQLQAEIPQIIKDNTECFTTKNKLLCYIEDMPEVGSVQIHFEYKGNYYIICGTSRQILLNIIEKLEEYK